MIPVEAFVPMATVAVALIDLLGTLLARERRRNHKTSNPGNPGQAICPILGTDVKTIIHELEGINKRLEEIGKGIAILKDRGRAA